MACVAVIVAEFDLAAGSSIRRIYPPNALPGFEDIKSRKCNALSELMLPDGAHNRDEDWTYFFLYRNLPQEEQDRCEYSSYSRRTNHSGLTKPFPKQQTESMFHMTQFADALLTDEMALGLTILDHVNDAAVGNQLAKFYLDRGKFSDFFASRLKIQLAASSNGISNIVSEPSLAFDAVIWTVAHGFMLKSIQPVLLKISLSEKCDLQIIASADAESSIGRDSAGQLSSLTQSIISAFVEGFSSMPVEMKRMIQTVASILRSDQGHEETQSIPEWKTNTALFLINRLLIAAMQEPHSHGLLVEPPAVHITNALSLLPKIFTRVAMGSGFKPTEGIFASMNALIATLSQSLMAAIQSIIEETLPMEECESMNSNSTVDLTAVDWHLNIQYTAIYEKLSDSSLLLAKLIALYGRPDTRLRSSVTSFKLEGGETKAAEWFSICSDGEECVTIIDDPETASMNLTIRSVRAGTAITIPCHSEVISSCLLDNNFIVIKFRSYGALGFQFSNEKDCREFRERVSKYEDHENIGTAKTTQHQQDMLSCASYLRQKRDESSKRMTLVRSVAVASPHQNVHIYMPLLRKAVDVLFHNPEDDVAEKVWVLLGEIAFPPRPSSAAEYLTRCYGPLQPAASPPPLTLQWKHESVTINIPSIYEPVECGDPSLSSLVRLFKDQIALIFNALLSEKRVVFFGRVLSAGQVAAHTLSAVLMVGDARPDILSRTYPYASLNDTAFTSVHAYVAGVANPIFEQQTKWWDIFADCDRGRVTCNPPLTADNEKQLSVYSHVVGQVLLAVQNGGDDVEQRVRGHFRNANLIVMEAALDGVDYVDESTINNEKDALPSVPSSTSSTSLTSLTMPTTSSPSAPIAFSSSSSSTPSTSSTAATANITSPVPSTTAAAAASSSSVVLKKGVSILACCGYAGAKSCATIAAQRSADLQCSSGRGVAAMRGYVLKLRRSPELTDEEIESMVMAMKNYVRSKENCYQLLSFLPISRGGLTIIASLLFHSSPSIRAAAHLLLSILDQECEQCVSKSLDAYTLSAYNRLSKQQQQQQ